MRTLVWVIDFFWRHFLHPDMAGIAGMLDGDVATAWVLFKAALVAQMVGVATCVALVAGRICAMVRK